MHGVDPIYDQPTDRLAPRQVSALDTLVYIHTYIPCLPSIHLSLRVYMSCHVLTVQPSTYTYMSMYVNTPYHPEIPKRRTPNTRPPNSHLLLFPFPSLFARTPARRISFRCDFIKKKKLMVGGGGKGVGADPYPCPTYRMQYRDHTRGSVFGLLMPLPCLPAGCTTRGGGHTSWFTQPGLDTLSFFSEVYMVLLRAMCARKRLRWFVSRPEMYVHLVTSQHYNC